MTTQNVICSVGGCERFVIARGWCRSHYAYWYKYGLTPKAAIKSFRRHGYSNTPTYRSWKTMLNRCNDINATGYERYGGRGITVCDRWRSFENFLADMGIRPEGRTLDRINNDSGYEFSNCRWATRLEQTHNRRLKAVS